MFFLMFFLGIEVTYMSLDTTVHSGEIDRRNISFIIFTIYQIN